MRNGSEEKLVNLSKITQVADKDSNSVSMTLTALHGCITIFNCHTNAPITKMRKTMVTSILKCILSI